MGWEALYAKGSDAYVKKKSEAPKVPDSNNIYPPPIQPKELFTIIGLEGGTAGALGVVGLSNRWSTSQWEMWIKNIQLLIIIYALLIAVTHILPYLYKLYIIKMQSKNDTPEEREKEREHDIILKEMEYTHKENMKAMELQKQHTTDENGFNNVSKDIN